MSAKKPATFMNSDGSKTIMIDVPTDDLDAFIAGLREQLSEDQAKAAAEQLIAELEQMKKDRDASKEEVWERLKHVEESYAQQEFDRLVSRRSILKKYLNMDDDEINEYFEQLEEYVGLKDET